VSGERIVVLESLQTDLSDRRSVYTIWLRFLAFAAAATIGVMLFAPSLWSCPNPGLPWNEETRILPDGKIPTRAPNLDQPKIVDTLRYRTSPQLDGSGRGNLSFFITADGLVKGIWNGEYDRSDGSHCVIMAASFSGNIDPAKPYIEGNYHDVSKLYFTTRGSFTLLETAPGQNSSAGDNGFMYVCGWIDPNYNATGKMFLTKNKKTFDVFSWLADAGD
jgi:hypothetical protein